MSKAISETELPGFTPGPETAADFRAALGRFATGVTVVTAWGQDGRPVGITANSFASVSLDPPLVLWSPARSSTRFAAFSEALGFSVHVLDDDQLDLARHFTRSGHWPEGHQPQLGAEGLPILPEALARFDCRTEARYDGGDHQILVGRVLHAHAREGQPLLFLRGKFGKFEPCPTAPAPEAKSPALDQNDERR